MMLIKTAILFLLQQIKPATENLVSTNVRVTVSVDNLERITGRSRSGKYKGYDEKCSKSLVLKTALVQLQHLDNSGV